MHGQGIASVWDARRRLNVMLEKRAGLAYDRLMEEAAALIDALKGNLHSFPHIRMAAAFGSRARGDARPTVVQTSTAS